MLSPTSPITGLGQVCRTRTAGETIRVVLDGLYAGLLVPARREGIPAVERTRPDLADIQGMALADTTDGAR